jgi:hypothetical protein
MKHLNNFRFFNGLTFYWGQCKSPNSSLTYCFFIYILASRGDSRDFILARLALNFQEQIVHPPDLPKVGIPLLNVSRPRMGGTLSAAQVTSPPRGASKPCDRLSSDPRASGFFSVVAGFFLRDMRASLRKAMGRSRSSAAALCAAPGLKGNSLDSMIRLVGYKSQVIYLRFGY